MKKSHIILIIFVAMIAATLVATYSGNSTSVSFAEAQTNNSGKEFKVSGTLDRTQPIVYDPASDASLTVFNMKDKEGKLCKVYLHEAKPQGMEQSESIDLYGKFKDGAFHASKILMKCPSKYNENKHQIQSLSDGTSK